MRIMFSIGTMSHGGAQRVISVLADELIKRNHDVEILTYYDEEIWYGLNKDIKLTCDEKQLGKANVIRHMLFRRKYINRQKPDVVLSFLAPFNMIMILVMLGMRIPLIVADRNDPNRVPQNCFVRVLRDFLYRFADRVVVQNESNRNYFCKSIQRKCDIIYNPIELGGNNGKALTVEKKDKIISVGRIIKQKNPLLLVDAFSRIAKEYPSYSLVFYGEGNMISDVLKYADELNIGDRVFCPGPVSDVYSNVCDSKLFVLSSDYEGMPNALLEAMCFGLPVISTKVSGATDVISNMENGILVDCNSISQMENAMRKMISNESFSIKCAENAKKLSFQLDKNSIVEQWLKSIGRVK